MSTVFTVGVFDLYHYGHLQLFKRCKALSNDGKVIIAVQDAASILKYKPSAQIVYSTAERCELVASCRFVDEVVIYQDVDEIVKKVDFDVFILGGDQTHDGFKRAAEYCEKNGRKVIRLTRTEGVSATSLRDRIKELQ